MLQSRVELEIPEEIRQSGGVRIDDHLMGKIIGQIKAKEGEVRATRVHKWRLKKKDGIAISNTNQKTGQSETVQEFTEEGVPGLLGGPERPPEEVH